MFGNSFEGRRFSPLSLAVSPFSAPTYLMAPHCVRTSPTTQILKLSKNTYIYSTAHQRTGFLVAPRNKYTGNVSQPEENISLFVADSLHFLHTHQCPKGHGFNITLVLPLSSYTQLCGKLRTLSVKYSETAGTQSEAIVYQKPQTRQPPTRTNLIWTPEHLSDCVGANSLCVHVPVSDCVIDIL